MPFGKLRSFIKHSANAVGIDIRRHRPEISEAGQLAAMLAANGVDVVLDVGANAGQFAITLRTAGYRGRIVSFEPLPEAHAALERASRSDSLWDVATRAAIGAEDGEAFINIAGNSLSSSMLGMLDDHLSAAPESAYIGRLAVPVRRLDGLADPFLRDDSIPFLKIDTQGFESPVLDGAPRLLERAAGLQLELSLVPLYAGQETYHSLVDRIRASGFELWAIWPVFVNPRTGRMLQVDAVFFR